MAIGRVGCFPAGFIEPLTSLQFLHGNSKTEKIPFRSGRIEIFSVTCEMIGRCEKLD
jgi:hypothetical protein